MTFIDYLLAAYLLLLAAATGKVLTWDSSDPVDAFIRVVFLLLLGLTGFCLRLISTNFLSLISFFIDEPSDSTFIFMFHVDVGNALKHLSHTYLRNHRLIIWLDVSLLEDAEVKRQLREFFGLIGMSDGVLWLSYRLILVDERPVSVAAMSEFFAMIAQRSSLRGVDLEFDSSVLRSISGDMEDFIAGLEPIRTSLRKLSIDFSDGFKNIRQPLLNNESPFVRFSRALAGMPNLEEICCMEVPFDARADESTILAHLFQIATLRKVDIYVHSPLDLLEMCAKGTNANLTELVVRGRDWDYATFLRPGIDLLIARPSLGTLVFPSAETEDGSSLKDPENHAQEVRDLLRYKTNLMKRNRSLVKIRKSLPLAENLIAEYLDIITLDMEDNTGALRATSLFLLLSENPTLVDNLRAF